MIIKDYFYFLKRFLLPGNKLLIFTTFVLTIISGVVSGFGMGLYIPVINYFISDKKSTNLFSTLSNKIISFLHLPVNFFNVIIIATLTIIVGAFITYLTMLCSGYLNLRGYRTVKVRLIDDLLKRPYQYFLHQKAGKVVAVITDQSTLASSTVEMAFRFFTNFVLTLAYLTSLLIISSFLTLAMLIFGVMITSLNQYFAKKLLQFSRVGQEIKFQQAHLFTETMIGIKTIKAMGLEKFRKKEVESSLEHERKIIFLAFRCFHLQPLTNKFMTVLFVSVSIVLSLKVFGLPGADIIVFLMVAARLGASLQDVNNTWLDLAKSLPYIQVVVQYMNFEETDESKLEKRTFNFKDSIKVEEVSFAYHHNRDVLKNINMHILKNQFIAFVGPSGEGKSTLLDLIVGLYRPSKGRILYDGRPLEYYSHENWCRSIGVVTQDIFLFNDSIAKNITYSDEHPDPKRIEEAARIAFAHDFILELKDGYDTIIGDRGVMLSGGQRQRIALARALYHQPKLLILDEATSNLDSESEKFIQKALENMYGNVTIIAVAHRLSTIRNADEIYYIGDGEIKESGQHNELIAGGTYYKKLTLIQNN